MRRIRSSRAHSLHTDRIQPSQNPHVEAEAPAALVPRSRAPLAACRSICPISSINLSSRMLWNGSRLGGRSGVLRPETNTCSGQLECHQGTHAVSEESERQIEQRRDRFFQDREEYFHTEIRRFTKPVASLRKMDWSHFYLARQALPPTLECKAASPGIWETEQS